MKKLFLSVLCVFTILITINAQSADDIVLDGKIGRALDHTFTYKLVPTGHYSLSWVNDPDPEGDFTLALWASSYYGMKFFTQSLPRFVITESGEIGIGTTTPQYKLDVLGTIRAKEIKVETFGADFVFEDDYNLLSLEEVATHIKEKKHLPEIPSAKEMQENGISLGEINTKLLQKIEELTLYLIKQDEEMKKQKEEIKELRSMIKN